MKTNNKAKKKALKHYKKEINTPRILVDNDEKAELITKITLESIDIAIKEAKKEVFDDIKKKFVEPKEWSIVNLNNILLIHKEDLKEVEKKHLGGEK